MTLPPSLRPAWLTPAGERGPETRSGSPSLFRGLAREARASEHAKADPRAARREARDERAEGLRPGGSTRSASGPKAGEGERAVLDVTTGIYRSGRLTRLAHMWQWPVIIRV